MRAGACSLVPLVFIPTARPLVVSFTGRATSDTALAGPGTVRFSHDAGHFGRPAAARPTYGQVVRVERLVAGLPDSIGAAVRRAGGRVVLVPWDYGADCSPVPWARSARWVPSAAHGLYEGRLRDRAHWTGDMPTLDVFAPQFVPYTGAAVARYQDASTTVGAQAPGWLTPDELLDVRALFPTNDEANARPDAAFARLRAWAAAHSADATRSPLREILASAAYQTSSFHFSRRPVPLAGTYRVTVRLAAGAGRGDPGAADSSTFYVRTEAHPASPAGSDGSLAGMYVLACATATEAALPAVRPPSGCDARHALSVEGYFAFGDSAWTDARGRRVWAGSVDVAHGDSAFQARFRDVTDDRVRTAPATNARRFLPGEWVEGPDGRVTFAWQLGPADAPVARVTAERVSRVTLRP